ncbi:Uncharacterised protein [Bordetella ansorpii]|uniref:Uncharacterized protein n=1 Tax=Bordetella ansorpii TaxID=288768 RepID=A0A146AJI9_9BORD|nr:hypothetical protein [Bordetella ansorpii]CZZ89180.1 Uncharacterised protein [Bordetella ansorpii]
MKTQISFKQLDGDDGVALVNGNITNPQEAKRILASKLDLPGEQEDIDARLKRGGIDPASIRTTHVSE